MKRAKARELTGDVVAAMWDQAYSLVQKGDYSGARLVIEQSLPSEAKALEKSIQKHIDANSNAKGNAIK